MSIAVYIFGTDHDFQGRNFSEVKIQAFISVIEEICSRFSIVAICEEFNQDALDVYKIAMSVPQEVANSKGIIHKFCDPSNDEREILGVEEVDSLHFLYTYHDLPEEEYYLRRNKSFSIREQYWLKELQKLDIGPVLFICGSKHSVRFKKLLGNNNISSKIIEKDWSY